MVKCALGLLQEVTAELYKKYSIKWEGCHKGQIHSELKFKTNEVADNATRYRTPGL